MLIVLEGCDGSGKSTLAERLAALLDASIIHCTTETANTKEFFEAIIKASKEKNIIADRFCYGQFVYQKGKERPLGTIQDLHELEIEMMEAGAKVILVTSPDEVVNRRLREREEIIINNLDTAEVKCRFYDLMHNRSLMGDSIMEWDTGGDRYEY